MKKKTLGDNIGVTVKEELISFLRFADNIALFTNSVNDLEKELLEIARCFQNYHLKIN